VNLSEQVTSQSIVADLATRLRAGKGKDGDLPKPPIR
jgi:hypothetical protein